MNSLKDVQEAELIIKLQNGDAFALGQLDKKYRAKIIQLIAKMVRNIEDAEDIYQEAILKAATHIDKFQSSGDFYAWLLTIALNQCRDHLRKAKRKPKVVCIEKAEKSLADGQEPLSVLENQELRAQIEEAIASLPSRQRQIAQLRLFYGLRYSQIADIIGGNANTIKALFSKAKTTLKNRLKSYIFAIVLPFQLLKKLSNFPIFSSLSSFTFSILLHILTIIFLFHLPYSTNRYKVQPYDIEVFLASEDNLSFGRTSAQRQIRFSIPSFKMKKEIELALTMSKEAERNLFTTTSFQTGLLNGLTVPSSISFQNRARFAPSVLAQENRGNFVFPNPVSVPDKESIETPKSTNSIVTREDKINVKRQIALFLPREVRLDIEGEIAKDSHASEKGQNAQFFRKPLLDVVFLYADHENSTVPQAFKEYILQNASVYKKEANCAYGFVKFIDKGGTTLHLYNLTTDIEQLKLWLEPDSRGVFLPNYGNSALDMIVAALEHISFREASRRLFLLMTRENISDMKEPLFKWTGEGRHRTGHYVSFYTIEEVLSMLKETRVSVSVISKDDRNALLLAKETGGKWTLWQTVLQ